MNLEHSPNHQTLPKMILVLLFLLVQTYLWFRFGVHQHFDSQRYLESSRTLLENGSLSHPHMFWYSSYALFLAFFQFLKLSLTWVVLAQVSLSALASAALYKMTLQIEPNNYAAFLATAFFILCIKVQWWNYYILTESLFISMNILFFYCLSKFDQPSWKLLLLIPLLVLVFFIRPSGIITVLSFIVYLFYLFAVNRERLKWMMLVAVGILATSFLILATMLESYDILEPLQNAEVICGVPQENWAVTNQAAVNSERAEWIQYVLFVAGNIGFFLKVSSAKAFYFWTTWRPENSFMNNLFSLCYFVPIYILAIYSLRNKSKSALLSYVLAFICLTFLMVLVTCVNWNSRFISPILPFVFLLAGLGASKLLGKWTKRLR